MLLCICAVSVYHKANSFDGRREIAQKWKFYEGLFSTGKLMITLNWSPSIFTLKFLTNFLNENFAVTVQFVGYNRKSQ